MVARAGVVALDLFLCTLRFCKYHGTRDRNVCAVSDSDTRRGNTNIPRGAFIGLLFQSRGCADSFWYHARADLLRRRLHYATHLVGLGTADVRDNDLNLERSRFYLVESPETLVTNMAGYSGTPLPKKLGIKEGARIALVNAPKDFQSELGELPADVKFLKPATKSLDIIVFFVLSERVLTRDFAKLAERLVANGMIWIAWPKKSSGVTTDLSEGRVRQIGLDAGLVDVKICAVDDTWSGLKFVYRLKDRPDRK